MGADPDLVWIKHSGRDHKRPETGNDHGRPGEVGLRCLLQGRQPESRWVFHCFAGGTWQRPRHSDQRLGRRGHGESPHLPF